MLKKTFAAAIVAGALLFTGASAANAVVYTPSVDVTAAPATVAVGGTTTITATFTDTAETSATFSVTPTTGASLSSIVRTAPSVSKPIVNGTATATFTGTTAGTYTVAVVAGDLRDTVTITVTAAGGSAALPSTGGELPAAALWVGAGALGLGALAVVAATARRRAAQR